MARVLLFCVAYAFCVLATNLVIAQTNPGCPRDWTYYAYTKKCVRVFGYPGDVNSPPLKWASAEEYCNRFNEGHLAAIESEDEDLFFVKLAHLIGYDEGTDAPIYFGLSFSGNSGWVRPDGGSVLYLKWWPDILPYLDGKDPAGYLCTRQRWTSYMKVASATDGHPFICQAVPLSDG